MAFEETMEVIKTVEPFVEQFISEKMKNPEDCWQPADFLPDFADSLAASKISTTTWLIANDDKSF